MSFKQSALIARRLRDFDRVEKEFVQLGEDRAEASRRAFTVVRNTTYRWDVEARKWRAKEGER
jgi:hypothetical protein